MKISELSSFLCAAAMVAMCLTARAEDKDNPAQAAARIAIAKALFAEQATNAPAMAADTNAMAQKQLAPTDNTDTTATNKGVADLAVADTKNVATDAQAQAKIVADQKAQADQAALATAQADATNTVAQVNTASTNVMASTNMSVSDMSMATTTNMPQASTNSWASGTSSNSPAMSKKDKKKKKEAAAAAAQPPVPMVDTNYIGGSLGMKRIAAPDLPISASKQDRLSALLQKYQADQITPEEYHQQRSAILAEP